MAECSRASPRTASASVEDQSRRADPQRPSRNMAKTLDPSCPAVGLSLDWIMPGAMPCPRAAQRRVPWRALVERRQSGPGGKKEVVRPFPSSACGTGRPGVAHLARRAQRRGPQCTCAVLLVQAADEAWCKGNCGHSVCVRDGYGETHPVAEAASFQPSLSFAPVWLGVANRVAR